MACMSYDVVSAVLAFLQLQPAVTAPQQLLQLALVNSTWKEAVEFCNEAWDRFTRSKWPTTRRRIRSDGVAGFQLYKKRMVATKTHFARFYKSSDLHPIEDCCNAENMCKDCPMFLEGLRHTGRMAGLFAFSDSAPETAQFTRPPVMRCDRCNKDIHLVITEEAHDSQRRNQRFATLRYDDRAMFRYDYDDMYEKQRTSKRQANGRKVPGEEGTIALAPKSGPPSVLVLVPTEEVGRAVMCYIAHDSDKSPRPMLMARRGFSILNELVLSRVTNVFDTARTKRSIVNVENGSGKTRRKKNKRSQLRFPTVTVLLETLGESEDRTEMQVPFTAPHRNPPSFIVCASQQPAHSVPLVKSLLQAAASDTRPDVFHVNLLTAGINDATANTSQTQEPPSHQQLTAIIATEVMDACNKVFTATSRDDAQQHHMPTIPEDHIKLLSQFF